MNSWEEISRVAFYSYASRSNEEANRPLSFDRKAGNEVRVDLGLQRAIHLKRLITRNMRFSRAMAFRRALKVSLRRTSPLRRSPHTQHSTPAVHATYRTSGKGARCRSQSYRQHEDHHAQQSSGRHAGPSSSLLPSDQVHPADPHFSVCNVKRAQDNQ